MFAPLVESVGRTPPCSTRDCAVTWDTENGWGVELATVTIIELVTVDEAVCPPFEGTTLTRSLFSTLVWGDVNLKRPG